MSRPSEPYLWRDPKSGRAYIGSKYTDERGGEGPVAEVYVNGPWLHISTGRYEGQAMLLANTIPLLIKELRKLGKATP